MLDHELPALPDLVALEHDVLRFWEQHRCFERLQDQNRDGPVFRFLDGPITANNPMGVHHAWGRTLKDVFLRYKALHGFTSSWQNGFDAQGLWVEVEVEKELGFSSKRDIETFGVANFVRRCKERVAKYAAVQTAQSVRLGQWMRWNESYFTNTDQNIEGIWYFLKRCHENGWIHRMRMPLTWCPRCGTSLSEHEAAGSHRELTHRSVFVKASLRDGRRALVWTTTPWTLPANVALAVNPAAMYCEMQTDNSPDVLVVGEQALPFAGLADTPVRRRFLGSELVGVEYVTFFPDLAAQRGVRHEVVAWREVNPREGTGIVHVAPGCGREDFELAATEELPIIEPIDEAARYVAGFDWLTGLTTADATAPIIAALEKAGRLLKSAEYVHSYPVCWRCKTETVFRLSEEWFIRSGSIRPRMLAAAAGVRWSPEHVGKLMEDWLTHMGDWNISRKRFYGLPLPFYPCPQCHTVTVVGSRQELHALAVDPTNPLTELHRPGIDAVRIRCPTCSATVPRIPEVGDVWLDAGIVPYSTTGFFDDRTRWQKLFPAEWVTEMREQVRLWFYSMLFMGVTLHDRAPYERVLSYESVLADDGRKFSKTGYSIAFDEAAEQMGADVMRYLFARARPGLSVRFGYALGDEVRSKLLVLWNACSFFNTYAVLDTPDLGSITPRLDALTQTDAWLLARTNEYLRVVTAAYDAFATVDVVREFEGFVEDVSNWYIRVNRRRFWHSDNSEDKRTAFWCLGSALRVVVQTVAPIVPFVTEVLWQKIVRRFDSSRRATVSVHLADWPREFPIHDRAPQMLRETAVAREVVNLALRLRNEHGIKVRQPLPRLEVVAGDDDRRAIERVRAIIAEQVNVKEVVLHRSRDQVEVARLAVDFTVAGPTLKGAVKQLQQHLAQLPDEQMRAAVAQYDSGQAALTLPDWKAPVPATFLRRETVPPADKLIAVTEAFTIALDTRLPQSLIHEGIVRDVVRQIQVLRKDAGFAVDDRIDLGIGASDTAITDALQEHHAFIMEQTLAESLREAIDRADVTRDVRVRNMLVKLAIRRTPHGAAGHSRKVGPDVEA